MTIRVRSFAGAWNRRFVRIVESLMLASVLLVHYVALIERVGMHMDENHFLVTSNVWEPFIAGDRSSAVWAESYVTLTSPPATRYVVGLGRALGGYGPGELPTLWTFGASPEQNAAVGAMPSDDLLWWSRMPMAVLATLACLASFWLMRSLFGLAAYVGLALIACSPWLGAILVRAMAEAPLVLSLLLVVAAVVRLVVAANHGRSLRTQLVWLGIAGSGAGLAASFKLSGLTCVVGVVPVWAMVVALGQPRRQPLVRVAIAGLGVALLCAVVAATMVALNPYLDPDPLGRLVKLVQFREQEMRGQMQIKTLWPIKGLADRLQFIFAYMFQQAVMVHHPAAGATSLALWSVGFGHIVRRGYNALRHGLLDPAGAALLVALTAAGPMLVTPLKWDRYLFLPTWFSALLVAVGITVTVRWLIGAAVGRSRRRAGVQLDETLGEPQPGS